MKKCPVCNSTYNDPTLNFCPEDGATLIGQTGSFGQSPGYPRQPPISSRKKRNPLLWILGIIGAVAIISIIGVVGLIALIAQQVGNNSNNGKRLVNMASNSNNGVYPVNSKASNSSGGNSSPKDAGNIDFARWGERKTAMGETKLVGDEFQVSAGQSGYYYVVISSSKFDDKYLTNDATTKVTTHSVTGDSPSLGYGLVINSDVDPLKSDYAFLIRSDNQTFRVVRHQNNKEETITDWTMASQIRTGTQTNQLEVRSVDDKLTFYINGKLATSLTDKNNTDEGLVGLYTSDTMPIGFSSLQIIKN